MKKETIKVLELNSYHDDPSEITKIIQRLFQYQAELGSAILDQHENPETQFISVTVDMDHIEPFWLKFLDLEKFTNGDIPVFCCEDCGCYYSSCSSTSPYSYRDINGAVGKSYECEVCKTFDCETIGKIGEKSRTEGPLAAKKLALSLLEEPTRIEPSTIEIVTEDNQIPEPDVPVFSGFVSIDSIPQIMDMLANNAWYGWSPQSIQLVSGENTVTLDGYVYEPGYEYFSATSSITLNGNVLYGYDSRNVDAYRNEEYQTGIFAKLDDAIADLKNHITGQTLQVSEPVPITSNVFCLMDKIDAAKNKLQKSSPNALFPKNHDFLEK